MSRKRKSYSPSFRAKVALADYRGDKTVQELAVHFQVSPQQISHWKSRLLERIEEIFHDNRVVKKEQPPNEPELFEQIGRLKMEVDWLKKNCPVRLTHVENGSIQTTVSFPGTASLSR